METQTNTDILREDNPAQARTVEVPKLTRCGACGDFQQDPKLYSEEEQKNCELIHCGCENIQELQYVTRDMAIDAGDLSLEGQRY